MGYLNVTELGELVIVFFFFIIPIGLITIKHFFLRHEKYERMPKVLSDREIRTIRTIGLRMLRMVVILYGIGTALIMLGGFVKAREVADPGAKLAILFLDWTLGYTCLSAVLGSIAYGLVGGSAAFRALLSRLLGKEYTLDRLLEQKNAIAILVEALQSSPRLSLIRILPCGSFRSRAKNPIDRAASRPPPGDTTRQLAVEGLGRLRSQEGVEPILQALKEDDSQLQDKAIWALGEIGDARAVQFILPFLGEERRLSLAFTALRNLREDRLAHTFDQALIGHLDSLSEIGSNHRGGIFEALSRALEDSSPSISAGAASALAKLNATESLPRLKSVLSTRLLPAEAVQVYREAISDLESLVGLPRAADMMATETEQLPRAADVSAPDTERLPRATQ